MALACPNASGHRRRAHGGRAVRCKNTWQAAQLSTASSCLLEDSGVLEERRSRKPRFWISLQWGTPKLQEVLSGCARLLRFWQWLLRWWQELGP